MKGVLPPAELPSFFAALEAMGARPRKSIRLRRDLGEEGAKRWSPARMIEEGIPLGERVPWYEHGYFFDLTKMDPHPSRHPVIAAGLAFIQEAGAMEVVPALEIRPQHLVLDLCAAPGAKSTQIGEYLGWSARGEQGWLVANEPVRDRAKLLDAVLARHGIGNSTVYNLEPHRLAQVFEGVFDRILVDAPCSGESLFAKREEKRTDVSDKEVARCALRQSAILENAARMLAPQGRLVYSTCAYSKTENEDVVAEFLQAHPEIRLVRETRRFPHRDGVPGGYFAVLDRAKVEDSEAGDPPDLRDRWEALRKGIRAIGEKGLVRDGLRKWDGTVDEYARAMDRKSVELAPEKDEKRKPLQNLEFTRDEAIRFLADGGRGFPFPEKDALYTWEGEPLTIVREDKSLYPKARLG